LKALLEETEKGEFNICQSVISLISMIVATKRYFFFKKEEYVGHVMGI
jgi:hypothetical protein